MSCAGTREASSASSHLPSFVIWGRLQKRPGRRGGGDAALGAELTGGVRDGRGHARLGAGGDGVAGDAVAPDVAGDDAGKAGDAGLGGAIVRLAGDAAQAR